MQKISISEARQNLPKLAEEVFFQNKTIILTKRGIPMVKIIKADKSAFKTKAKNFDFNEAIKLAGKIQGIWNDKKWTDKSSSEIADWLRVRSQRSYVR